MSKHNKPYFQSQQNPQAIAQQSGAIVFEGQIRTGPIPAPAEIGEYERILPGSADRIIKMAEKEQAHRHEVESRGQKHRIGITFVGQLFAFLMGISGIAGGVYLVKSDKSIAGFGVFFTSLATLMGVFFYNRRHSSQKQNSSERGH